MATSKKRAATHKKNGAHVKKNGAHAAASAGDAETILTSETDPPLPPTVDVPASPPLDRCPCGWPRPLLMGSRLEGSGEVKAFFIELGCPVCHTRIFAEIAPTPPPPAPSPVPSATATPV